MKYDNEKYCKELGLIPIKNIFVCTDVNFRKSQRINFNSEYGIKIENDHYTIISLKRSKPMTLSYNGFYDGYQLSMYNKSYYINDYLIKNYLNYINKKDNSIKIIN